MKLPEQSLNVLHIGEPPLEFGAKQKTAHPKDGLFLYGPHGKGKRTTEIKIGVVGTIEGANMFRDWLTKIKKRVEVPPPTKREKKDRLHLANFPGLEEAFGITVNEKELSILTLDKKVIDEATRIINPYEATSRVTQLYLNRIRRYIENEERDVDLWVLVVPEFVKERCTPKAKRAGLPLVRGDFGKKQSKRADIPLLETIIDQQGEGIFEDVPDFHRQVKAACLNIAPTQIVRETTINPLAEVNSKGYPARRTQDEATIAWNIATGLYYKTQENPPWKLHEVRPGVCYIGLVYKNLPNDPNGHVCCAAQMFLSEGDGVVFRGANGPWKTSEDEFHLKPPAAKELLQKVLDTYAEKHKGPPRELFIHGKATFNDEEWKAFEEVVPKETNIVGVRIRTTSGENKLFRDGDYPVLRGTALILDDRNANIWTTGYVPQLDTYVGPETPNPLFVTLLRSKDKMPSIQRVLEDIMGLTKINYNSCNYNDGLPVTVRFANMVGDVLVMGLAKDAKRQPFKFYV